MRIFFILLALMIWTIAYTKYPNGLVYLAGAIFFIIGLFLKKKN
jgi:hypothetical protein